MRKFKLLYLFLLVPLCSFGQNEYAYRVTLKDKGKTNFELDRPQDFLSQKSINRRFKQGIAIDESDLPIAETYLSSINSLGCTIISKSKWLSTVDVHSTDTTIVDALIKLSFVKNVSLVWENKLRRKLESTKPKAMDSRSEYGYACNQIALNNGTDLHDNGYKGDGMEIAIIDGGYNNLDSIGLFDNLKIEGMKDFVYNGIANFSGSEHGINVLSCMATNKPGAYLGTAPYATYWLLRSEDSRSEYPIEEDYWAAAAEYADSVGVDVISSSLGYGLFDNPLMNIDRSTLDGKTIPISIAAEMATKKGIFVVTSAGNSGAKEWGTITAPADAADVLTVGSVDQNAVVSDFSSRGPTADLRIKPDVMALGENVAVIDQNGIITYASGTSFSAPIMAGLVACLWQANPSLTNIQLLSVVRRSSDRYQNPDGNYGYGVPNMTLAMSLATEAVEQIPESHFVFCSDSIGQLRIVSKDGASVYYELRINDLKGQLYASTSFFWTDDGQSAYESKGGLYHFYKRKCTKRV